MKKRKTEHKPSRAKSADKPADLAKPEEPTDEEKKRFDFGGLPARDLKKNLGCG